MKRIKMGCLAEREYRAPVEKAGKMPKGNRSEKRVAWVKFKIRNETIRPEEKEVF